MWTDITFSTELDTETWCGDFGIPVVDLTSGHLRYCDVHSCPPGSHCYRQPDDSLPALCCRRRTSFHATSFFVNGFVSCLIEALRAIDARRRECSHWQCTYHWSEPPAKMCMKAEAKPTLGLEWCYNMPNDALEISEVQKIGSTEDKLKKYTTKNDIGVGQSVVRWISLYESGI